MRLGYVQERRQPHSGQQELERIRGCDKLYVERSQDAKRDWRKRPVLRQLLEQSQPGDTLVIEDLEGMPFHYHTWLELVSELRNWQLELEVLAFPGNQLRQWQQLFQWMQRQDQAQATIKIRKFSKERSTEKSQYRFFSRDPYFRRAYREILQQVMAKRSLRQITKESGAPLGTVVRIRKEYAKFKQTLLLVGTFILTIISLKMAQAYSPNPFLQVGICAIMTVLIIYLSYSDSQSD
ncbi:recombinase family protein [Vagococcus sp. BWB3-3]|uniref:Recombinase family protein n=1 Tax=Vagococcus allomyrinae TaxID=2794353 RepID=A0A940PA22_9ENTE|nr:recombinase family protein [Vagococcus allomyrinae]MBP1040233.1 recombinase family protein [Vagococcus allomyrinae]